MIKVLILFLFTFSSVVFSQISITKSDIDGRMQIGMTHTEFIDSSTSFVDIGATGQSSWDFSNWTYDNTLVAENINPSSAPVVSEFSSATIVEYSQMENSGVPTEFWNYVLLNSEEYSNLGFYSSSSVSNINTTTLMKLDKPEIITDLNMEYGDSWQQTTVRDFETEASGYTTTYSVETDITRTVDAWGTLTFPDGSDKEVLRVKVESEVTSNVTGSPVTTYDLHYTFFSKSGAFLTVTAEDHNAPDNGTIDITQVVWAYGSGTTDFSDNEEIGEEFHLAQNYPNPFNPVTKIKYTVPERSDVSLKVLNLLGEEVAIVAEGIHQPGNYEESFNAHGLSSGVYLYRLRSDNYVETKKLMLIK